MFAPIMVLGTTQAASRPKGLWVGGVDVIYQPGSYWTPIESIHISEAGPGNVSSMEFVIECVGALTVAVADGMDVRFWNNTTSKPIFLGFVDHVDIENMTGNLATKYTVICTGIEAVLDWSLIAADLVIPAGTTGHDAVLSCVANAVGNALAWLYAFAFSGGTGIIAQGQGVVQYNGISSTVTITAGTTLREAIRQVSGQCNSAFIGTAVSFYSTVDFWGGLRWWYEDSLLSGVTTDFGTFFVDDDPPLTNLQAENLQYGIDASQVRGVIVKGTGVTVFVGDGTGKPGSIALLNDSTITTTAAATAAGVTYLAPYLATARGSLEQQDWSPPVGERRPGGTLTINDARVFTGTPSFMVTGIEKTFNPSGRENWVISFGGDPPSVTQLTRQLTRGTLS